ncbi:hypothetical protein, partial [Mycoplasma phocimorsus]|uniref:hypothetical protein n=1 Tax=Mycoplasma phocimorsus TaxID=3045839 RepID=UPI0024BF8B47
TFVQGKVKPEIFVEICLLDCDLKFISFCSNLGFSSMCSFSCVGNFKLTSSLLLKRCNLSSFSICGFSSIKLS